MLVKMICPQCGASLEMDNSREIMFCKYCGTKIANVAERVNVVHSGKVTIDESGKLKNYRYMAQNALNSRNYGEAYAYCMRILENDYTDPFANLFRCFSIVMQSSPYANRMSEGVASISSMLSTGIIKPEGASVISSFVRQVCDSIPQLYEAYCPQSGRQQYANEAEALNVQHFAYGTVGFITAVTAALRADLLRAVPSLEEDKRRLITEGLELARRASAPVQYVAGYTTGTDRHGRVVREPQIAKSRCPHTGDLKQCVEYMKKEYNELPSTVSGLADFDKRIAGCNKLTGEYDEALNAYFADHIEDGNAYRHPGIFGREKKRAAIEATFPRELLEKRDISLRAEADAAKIKAQKKAFMKERLI